MAVLDISHDARGWFVSEVQGEGLGVVDVVLDSAQMIRGDLWRSAVERLREAHDVEVIGDRAHITTRPVIAPVEVAPEPKAEASCGRDDA